MMNEKQIEALRLAREALEIANSCVDGYYMGKGRTQLPEVEKALAAIDEALAEQPAQTEFKPDWMNYQQGKADGAAAAVEREREELARFFEDHWREEWADFQIAAAIRARGETSSRGQA